MYDSGNFTLIAYVKSNKNIKHFKKTCFAMITEYEIRSKLPKPYTVQPKGAAIAFKATKVFP